MKVMRLVTFAVVVCIGLGLSLVASPVSAGACVSVSPQRSEVEPGEVFTVFIWKDSVDITFDGYEAVVTYDPAIIQYLGASEESVMTDPCWNRWWVVTPDSGSIFISHAMMCGGTTAQGPGALSGLTFEALAEGSTAVSVDYFWFTLGGLWIKDVDWHDGIVDVADLSGVAAGAAGGQSALDLKVRPNPARAFDIIVQGAPPTGGELNPPSLEIYDALGRAVASPQLRTADGNRWTYSWDGTGKMGCQVAGGIYFARTAHAGVTACRRIILLR
jgi:YD repeat-containing protein